MSLRITELVNCKYTGRSHLECNHHKLIRYRVGTLSMCSQCIHNVPGGCTDPCPQCVLWHPCIWQRKHWKHPLLQEMHRITEKSHSRSDILHCGKPVRKDALPPTSRNPA